MKKFLSYNEAKRKVRQYGITTIEEYKNKYKGIPGLPSARYLSTAYKEFTNYNDFFGKEAAGGFDEYDKFLKFVNEANIKSGWEYRRKYKASFYKLPCEPSRVYKEFTSWDNILGERSTKGKQNWFKKKNYVSLDEAKKLIAELKKSGIRLNSNTDYNTFVKSEEYKKNYSDKLPKILYYYKQSKGYTGYLDILGEPVEVAPAMYSLQELKELFSKKKIRDIDAMTVYMFTGPKEETSMIPDNIEEYYKENEEWNGLDSLFEKKEEKKDKMSVNEVLEVINRMEAMLEELKDRLV